MGSYDRVKVSKGDDFVIGTEADEIFVISNSKNNADTIRFDDFGFGSDLLHFGSRNSEETLFEWIDDGGDGESNDLLITVGDQEFILIDLADQITVPTTYRFEQGFEVDTSGFLDQDDAWYGTVTMVASGTGGITSASGDYHAIFENADPLPFPGYLGGGYTGPFSDLGGYESTWQGEWSVSADIYLNTSADGSGWALGEGFDWSVASSGSDGDHQRDFIFHVTQDSSTGDLYVGGSNNTNFAPREDLDTLANSYVVAEDGWYTFEHHFYDNGGSLAVDLNLYDDSGALLFTETRNDASDLISTEVGGNRYGWFTTIDVAGGIAVDNVTLEYEADQSVPVPTADDIFFV